MKTRAAGFTIVEILVVIFIISVLAGVLFMNYSQGSAQARDADRQADLRKMQSAVELYRQENGRYPAGCNAAGSWSGQTGTSYACGSGGSNFIVGLAPEYIPALPSDPKLNGNTSGYIYTTNADGSVYKLMAKNTVESEVVTINHEFKSCDVSGLAWVSCTESDILPPISLPLDRCDAAICDRTYPTYNRPNYCNPSNIQFQTSYGVWGGYAYVDPSNSNRDLLVERYTEDILCDIP
tara:strand:+ start:882 stop:1592 length:711 start_codon:yes stop_codon:yes gene_type:complete